MIMRPEVLKVTIRDVSRLHRKPRLTWYEESYLHMLGVDGLMSYHGYDKDTDSVVVRYSPEKIR